MTTRKKVTALLVGLLLVIHAQLWWGRGSVPQVHNWRSELQNKEIANADMRLSNQQLTNEVRDLQDGLHMVEAMARQDLGMIKSDEIFVQIRRPAAP